MRRKARLNHERYRQDRNAIQSEPDERINDTVATSGSFLFHPTYLLRQPTVNRRLGQVSISEAECGAGPTTLPRKRIVAACQQMLGLSRVCLTAMLA